MGIIIRHRSGTMAPMKRTLLPWLAAAALGAAPCALAHGPESSVHEQHAHAMSAGEAVPVKPGLRTIEITMDDSMRYTPAQLHVKRGEAVRIVAINHGKLVHEVVLGTRKDLEQHARHMREHPGMKHDDGSVLQVPGGEKREMGWRFTHEGSFLYGCLVPGHFEAGMVGTVVVAR